MRLFTRKTSPALSTPPEKPSKALWFTWGIIGALAVAVALWSPLAGFEFPILNFLYLTIATAGMQVCALLIKTARPRDGEYAFILLQSIAIILVGSIVSQMVMYLGTAAGSPFIDNTLIAADRILGFDWKNYFTWLRGYPAVIVILDVTYHCLLPEMALILWLFALTQRIRDTERFIVIYFITLLVTIAIASLWPAMGAFIFYDIDPARFGLNLAAARIQEHDLLALHNHLLTHIPVIMRGLVTFPSFHVTGAFIMMWISWPLRYWRPFNITLNTLMIISAISSGGHYLADVIGGIIIGLLGVYATDFLMKKYLS